VRKYSSRKAQNPIKPSWLGFLKTAFLNPGEITLNTGNQLIHCHSNRSLSKIQMKTFRMFNLQCTRLCTSFLSSTVFFASSASDFCNNYQQQPLPLEEIRNVSTHMIHRVCTDIKTLFSRTFQDLQRPNSRVFQDSKNAFSRTFQDTIRSQTWLHEVKKCTYQISFRCNCITVNKPKCNTCGDIMRTMYYNEFLL